MKEREAPSPDEGIKHLAIIMDGNGRWAQTRHRPRVWGHVRGAKIASRITEHASRLGLKSLTLYAFSTENWKRPEFEVSLLFRLLEKFVADEREKVLKNNIRFRVIGNRQLPEKALLKVKSLEEESAHHTGMILNLAISYGGRDELLRAFERAQAAGVTKLTEEGFSSFLDCPEHANLDLLIRTGGDGRVSNFLLWQLAYAELWFTDMKWPDFDEQLLENILRKVSTRERRFGALSEGKEHVRT